MICLLGIDALEYNLIEDMNLKNIMQKQYMKLSIPDECCRNVNGELVPYSPYCWESILTGEKPLESIKVYKNSMLERIRQKVGPNLKFIKGKRKFLEKFGLKYYRGDKPHPSSRSLNTFFDIFPVNIDFNVPTYSLDYVFNPFKEIDDREMQILKMLEFADEEFELFKKFTLIMTSRKFDLIMVYTRLLDWYGHFRFGTNGYYYRYKLVDLFLKDLSKKFSGIILVLSDHGMKNGNHTTHAFFSTNKKTDAPKSLLDIHKLLYRYNEEKVLST